MKRAINDAVLFYKLEWDTKHFGVNSAKAILHKPLTPDQWKLLKLLFTDYEFVSIENRNSEPINAQFIAKETKAFLVDVNIQFIKELCNFNRTLDYGISIQDTVEKDERILKLVIFQHSKFTDDPELSRRNGDQVYYQWVLNSFNKSDKIFAISKNENGKVNGFLLHSYSDSEANCIVELMAVAHEYIGYGIGTKLFKAVEHSAFSKGCQKISVGTQLRNMGAINFYHKMGCKQIGCHQVYHLWNL